MGTSLLWDKLENQIYLGTEPWMKEVRKIVESRMRSDDHPRAQRDGCRGTQLLFSPS